MKLTVQVGLGTISSGLLLLITLVGLLALLPPRAAAQQSCGTYECQSAYTPCIWQSDPGRPDCTCLSYGTTSYYTAPCETSPSQPCYCPLPGGSTGSCNGIWVQQWNDCPAN